MSRTITTENLWKAVISGEITIDWCEHKPSYAYSDKDRLNKVVQERLDRHLNNANGANDGKWHDMPKKKKDADDTNEGMRDLYRSNLDRTYQNGEVIEFMPVGIKEVECSCCGASLLPHLDLSNKKLSYSFQHKFSPSLRIEEAKKCDMADKTEFTSKINVSSPLILANHFFEQFKDAPKEKEYTSSWSLCNLKGRENITKHLESQNIAYGQLTNTTACVFLSNDKKSIIIGEDYYYNYDEETDIEEEGEREHEGYSRIGDICCGVWRWMGTDKNTLTQQSLDKMKKDSSHMDVLELEVPHGEWKMTHYYDFGKNPNLKEGIWAKIELVK